MAAVTLAACAHASALRLLSSNILHSPAFRAPLTGDAERRLLLAPLISNILEDLPQITIQLYCLLSHRSPASVITIISLLTSIVNLLVGVIRRILVALVFAKQKNQKNGAPNPPVAEQAWSELEVRSVELPARKRMTAAEAIAEADIMY